MDARHDRIGRAAEWRQRAARRRRRNFQTRAETPPLPPPTGSRRQSTPARNVARARFTAFSSLCVAFRVIFLKFERLIVFRVKFERRKDWVVLWSSKLNGMAHFFDDVANFERATVGSMLPYRRKHNTALRQRESRHFGSQTFFGILLNCGFFNKTRTLFIVCIY